MAINDMYVMRNHPKKVVIVVPNTLPNRNKTTNHFLWN